MLALGHAEVLIRVISLVDDVGRSGRADGQHSRPTLRPLSPSDLLECSHRNIRVNIPAPPPPPRRRPESINYGKCRDGAGYLLTAKTKRKNRTDDLVRRLGLFGAWVSHVACRHFSFGWWDEQIYSPVKKKIKIRKWNMCNYVTFRS